MITPTDSQRSLVHILAKVIDAPLKDLTDTQKHLDVRFKQIPWAGRAAICKGLQPLFPYAYTWKPDPIKGDPFSSSEKDESPPYFSKPEAFCPPLLDINYSDYSVTIVNDLSTRDLPLIPTFFDLAANLKPSIRNILYYLKKQKTVMTPTTQSVFSLKK